MKKSERVKRLEDIMIIDGVNIGLHPHLAQAIDDAYGVDKEELHKSMQLGHETICEEDVFQIGDIAIKQEEIISSNNNILKVGE